MENHENHGLVELGTASTDTLGTPFVARPEDSGFYAHGFTAQ